MSLNLYPAETQFTFDGQSLSGLCGTFTDCRATELTQFTLYNGVAAAIKLLQKNSKAVSYL
ncbi:hypothetical protein PM8797T_01979 [Gimesia maris DSM 8797]|nr:hypothetical protein PM8797T_01979 [Gimesia maris DSM 8797]